MDFVNELVVLLLLHLGLSLVGFIGAYIIAFNDFEYGFFAFLNLFWIIGSAIARQKKLQHKGWHIDCAFDFVKQVFANDLAGEQIYEFGI